MAQEYASSIKGEALRLTTLDATGAVSTEKYIIQSFVTVSFTPEYEDGEELTQKNAAGEVCVSYKMPDVLKRVTLELAVCNPDPELDELLLANSYLIEDVGGDAIGFAAPAVGVSTAGNGASLELWSSAIVDGKPSSTFPYWHWLFPLVHLRPSGTREVGPSIMANTYSGYGIGNKGYGTGVSAAWADFAAPITAGSPYMYVRTATAPPTSEGLITGA